MSWNGLLLVDKPKDCTSHDVVYKVKKNLNVKYVGHAGTLDPLASGLLVILLGEATKLSNFILSGDKAYECKILLGKTSDTLDVSGNLVETSDLRPNKEEVINAIETLVGSFEWEVPIYSAKKVDGKKLYEYARESKKIELPLKNMTFYEAKLISYEYPHVTVQLKCSKGSFIRTWSNELGKLLQTGACIEELRRIYSDPYNVEDALEIEDLEEGLSPASEAFVPISMCLEDFPSLEVNGLDHHLIVNGQISQTLRARLKVVDIYNSGACSQFKVVDGAKNLIAIIGKQCGGTYKLARVFRA